MTFEAVIEAQAEPLVRRLERMVGSREAAEDLRQETYLRAWRSAPPELSAPQVSAWMHRTAANLAVDELRRRRLRDHDELPETAAAPGGEHEALAVREALGRLAPEERVVLRLRFEAGLSHAELGEALGVTREAARKRVERARAAFRMVWRDARPDARPLILLIPTEDWRPYEHWLEGLGARVRVLPPDRAERELATADGLVFSGSRTDVHPALYGEQPRARLGPVDLARDRRELAVLRAALDRDLPVLGVCRGHQLLNVARGGDLHQDLNDDGVTRSDHRAQPHQVTTVSGTLTRRATGARPHVASEHHQAIRRLGQGLRPSAYASDGVIEGIELPGARYAVGLQWHPEEPEAGVAGRRLGDAFVAASRAEERAA